MAIVYIPTPMRKLTNGRGVVETDGATVEQVFVALDQRYPGARTEIYDERGAIKSFVAIFVNGRDIRTLNQTETPVGDQDEVYIVPAIAGGCETVQSS